MSDPPKGILPTTPPPSPPPDLHAALEGLDMKRLKTLLESNDTWNRVVDRGNTIWVIDEVIDAIREQLPPPVAR